FFSTSQLSAPLMCTEDEYPMTEAISFARIGTWHSFSIASMRSALVIPTHTLPNCVNGTIRSRVELLRGDPLLSQVLFTRFLGVLHIVNRPHAQGFVCPCFVSKRERSLNVRSEPTFRSDVRLRTNRRFQFVPKRLKHSLEVLPARVPCGLHMEPD